MPRRKKVRRGATTRSVSYVRPSRPGKTSKKRYRIKGRFYIIVAALLALMGWGVYALVSWFAPPEVAWGRLATDREVTLAVVREEQLVMSDQYARLNCLVAEGETVEAGASVAELYTSGYSEKDMQNLATLQQRIKDYQENNLMQNVADRDLDALNEQITLKMDEISTLIGQGQVQNLVTKEREFSSLMDQRRTYMKEHITPNAYLEDLYSQEAQLQEKINGSKTVLSAPGAGIVSYFMDGYEDMLRTDALDALTASGVSAIMDKVAASGGTTASGNAPVSANQAIYRLVNPNAWYGLIVLEKNENTLVEGGTCDLFLEGSEDLISANVQAVREDGGKVLIILKVDGPIGSLVRTRKVQGHLGRSIEGFRVPGDRVTQENGQAGVYVRVERKRVFVPVTVLASDATHAIVQPQEGSAQTLQVGQKVLSP